MPIQLKLFEKIAKNLFHLYSSYKRPIDWPLWPKFYTPIKVAVTHLRPTSDWPVMLCDRLTADLRPGRDLLELTVSLDKSLNKIKKKFQSDLRPIYDRAKRHTRQPSKPRPIYKELRPKDDLAASWVTRKLNWQVPRPFSIVKSDCGACRFQ